MSNVDSEMTNIACSYQANERWDELRLAIQTLVRLVES